MVIHASDSVFGGSNPSSPAKNDVSRHVVFFYNLIGGLFMDYSNKSTFSTASGNSYQYVVLQVTLKEKFIGTGSGNLSELEACINDQARKGYRLHTITTSNGGSKGLMGGDRIQATMVFEKIV